MDANSQRPVSQWKAWRVAAEFQGNSCYHAALTPALPTELLRSGSVGRTRLTCWIERPSKPSVAGFLFPSTGEPFRFPS